MDQGSFISKTSLDGGRALYMTVCNDNHNEKSNIPDGTKWQLKTDHDF